MRLVTIVAAATLGLAFVYQVHAASQQDWSECAGKDPAVTIQACSRIISDQTISPSDRADGYLFRAGTYLSQRDFDLAVADYTEAIRLTTRNVTAYAGRALAYFHKGNLDQAAADFAVISQLDSAKAAELAATNADLKEIAALAHGRAPAPSEAPAVAGKPLPRNVGLSEQVVEFLEANELIAQSPPLAVKAFNIDSSSNSDWSGPLGRSTITMVGKNQHRLEALGGGLFRYESNAQNESKTTATGKPATISHATMKRTGLSIANGLFDLNSTMAFQTDGRHYKSETRLARIEKLSGKMFPLQVNNHFSFVAVFEGAKPGDESTSETNCVVSREFDAKSFHADLTGKAFLATCESFSMNKATKTNSLTARDKNVFFEELGYWIKADPVAPSERIMNNNNTATVNDMTSKMSTSMILKSFSLGP
jgi:tetratricopeptide (TPR) repeat protein